MASHRGGESGEPQDYLEALAEGINPLIETVKAQHQPFIKMADTKTQLDRASIEKQPETKLYPFMELVFAEVESVKFETPHRSRSV
jgi:hypothetical protein